MTITGANRSSQPGSYPSNPLAFSARLTAGHEGEGLLASGALTSTAPASAGSPGTFYMISQPLVLASVGMYAAGFANSGEVVTMRLLVDGALVRSFTFAYDDGVPMAIGALVFQDFEPLIVNIGSWVALQWGGLDPADVEPFGTMVNFQ